MEEIKNLKKVANRIIKAVKNKETIVLFGDSDLDGTTATLIAEEAIKSLSGNIQNVYFPDWEADDYGLSFSSLKKISKYAPGLLCLFDCGIGNFKEIKEAKKLGFEIIVVDHHNILDKIPSDALVVDPKQEGDYYPYKNLTAASLSYELSVLLLGELSPSILNGFAELAALGTIADMMPLEGANAFVVSQGSSSIKNSLRPGLKAIVNLISRHNDSPRDIFQKLVSILNISPVKNNLTKTYILLTERNYLKAEKVANELITEAENRKIILNDVVETVSDIAKNASLPIIFEGLTDIAQVMTGSIASRVCNKHKKPTFIFKLKQGKSRGSVRVPKGINAVDALKNCDKYLEMYGGHPPAAGFMFKNKNKESFKQCLLEYFNKNKIL